jgi:hypothetical protein
MADEVAKGAHLTPKAVRRRCDDHVRKQQHGALSTSLYIEPDTALASAVQQTMERAPGTPEYRTARQVIDSAHKAKRSRTPNERHQARMALLYVDLTDDGRTWSVPSKQDLTVSRRIVEEAANDYASELHQLEDTEDPRWPNMARVRVEASCIVALAEPVWPKAG